MTWKDPARSLSAYTTITWKNPTHSSPLLFRLQLLLLDTDSDLLIACGTLFYGSCDRVDLSDITTVADPAPRRIPTVPNDPTKPVVGFFVPAGRLTYDFGGVYVGASYSLRGNPDYQASGPVYIYIYIFVY